MGIDAVMYVEIPGEVSTADLKAMGYELGSCVGPESFLTWAPEVDNNLPWRKQGRGPLEFADFSDDGDENGAIYGLTRRDGFTLVQVSLSGRYYGRGYERGNLWTYVAVGAWFESQVAGCTVWYGGDSSDELDLFDEEYQSALIQHWAEVGGRPHYSYHCSNETLSSGRVIPNCPVCDVALNRSGWGGNGDEEYAHVSCMGCGYSRSTRDGGQTWKEEESPF